MGIDGPRARELAQAWFLSDAGYRARERGFAHCDKCLTPIAPGEGMLVSPVYVGTDGPTDSEMPRPELVCEECFERKPLKPWNPDEGGVLGRPLTPASELFPPAGEKPAKPKRRGLFRRSGS